MDAAKILAGAKAVAAVKVPVRAAAEAKAWDWAETVFAPTAATGNHIREGCHVTI